MTAHKNATRKAVSAFCDNTAPKQYMSITSQSDKRFIKISHLILHLSCEMLTRNTFIIKWQ